MTKDRNDEALARLRAADPAAGLEPDHEALRRAVTERAGTVDELAVRRRRSARTLQVAAAGAGALAIGLSGFALGGGFAGSVVASGDESGGEALPAIRLDGGGVAAESPQGEPEIGVASPGVSAANPGMGGAGRAESMASADALIYPGFTSRTVFSHAGLSTSGTSAKAYGYDAASAVSADTLRELAAALGIEGKVREEYGSLAIGSWEKGEPVVQLFTDGTASFHFNDPSKDLFFCAEGAECEERDLGDAVQGDDAIEQAREFLVTLGQDPASFEFEASSAADYGTTDYSHVTAFRVVDGQRSGDSWGVGFTGAGIQSASGALAELVDLGEYQVVSPAEAVERLGDPRFGSGGFSYPPGWAGPARPLDSSVSSDAPSVPGTPTPGGSFDWPVESVTITSQRLGLAQHYLGDGGVALVPTYVLTADDGRSWSVIAVAEEHLSF